MVLNSGSNCSKFSPRKSSSSREEIYLSYYLESHRYLEHSKSPPYDTGMSQKFKKQNYSLILSVDLTLDQYRTFEELTLSTSDVKMK